MAGSGVTLYGTTASGNKVVIGSIDWRENTYMPSQINDNVAQIMADIRAMANGIATGWVEFGDGDGVYTATYVAANQFRIDGADVSAYYRVGMRVRAVAPTPGTLNGTISAVAYTAPNTLVTVAWDSGAGLSNEAITAILIGIGSGGGSGGQLNYRNILGRNGGFEVWQRGAGGSATIAYAIGEQKYGPDGWYFYSGTNLMTVWQTGGIVNSSRYCCVVQRNVGQTGVGLHQLEFPLDTDEIVLMRNAIVTLSFTAIAGANFSAAGQLINASLVIGTGAAPGRVTGGGITSPTNIISAAQALTTTPTRYTFTANAVVPVTATQASVVFNATPVGTAGASDYFIVDDVQLEVGGPTPFERRPFESELLACKRHFQKSFNYTQAPAGNLDTPGAIGTGQTVAASIGIFDASHTLPVTMRTTPTLTFFNPKALNAQVRNIALGVDCSATGLWVASPERFSLTYATAPGSALGQPNYVHYTADAGI